MKDVIVTRPMLGITGMQACCKKGLSKNIILRECNAQNPAGTRNGWSIVIRTKKDVEDYHLGDNSLPIACDDHEDREHLIIIC